MNKGSCLIHILLVIPAKIILIIPFNKNQGPLLQKLLFPAPLFANDDNNYSKSHIAFSIREL